MAMVRTGRKGREGGSCMQMDGGKGIPTTVVRREKEGEGRKQDFIPETCLLLSGTYPGDCPFAC